MSDITRHNSIKEISQTDIIDTITMDVPLFIRMLEFAREDADTDMILHKVTERAISLSKEHNLTMDDYDSLVDKTSIKSETFESILRIFKNI